MSKEMQKQIHNLQQKIADLQLQNIDLKYEQDISEIKNYMHRSLDFLEDEIEEKYNNWEREILLLMAGYSAAKAKVEGTLGRAEKEMYENNQMLWALLGLAFGVVTAGAFSFLGAFVEHKLAPKILNRAGEHGVLLRTGANRIADKVASSADASKTAAANASVIYQTIGDTSSSAAISMYNAFRSLFVNQGTVGDTIPRPSFKPPKDEITDIESLRTRANLQIIDMKKQLLDYIKDLRIMNELDKYAASLLKAGNRDIKTAKRKIREALQTVINSWSSTYILSHNPDTSIADSERQKRYQRTIETAMWCIWVRTCGVHIIATEKTLGEVGRSRKITSAHYEKEMADIKSRSLMSNIKGGNFFTEKTYLLSDHVGPAVAVRLAELNIWVAAHHLKVTRGVRTNTVIEGPIDTIDEWVALEDWARETKLKKIGIDVLVARMGTMEPLPPLD